MFTDIQLEYLMQLSLNATFQPRQHFSHLVTTPVTTLSWNDREDCYMLAA